MSNTPQGALATRNQPSELVAQGMEVRAIAGRQDLERYHTVVTIPADFQYLITRWKPKNKLVPKDIVMSEGQNMVEIAAKRGIAADGYDYINRALGATFYLPPWVHNESGEPQRNPIHRKDYIYLRMAIVYYTPVGQLVEVTEDVEVDYNLVWMDARINSRSAEVKIDENGLPQFDNFGNPALTLSKEDELKALKSLSQLRSFGPRYAQTVARVRLLKMATGLRSLPLDNGELNAYQVPVVGFRDKLTPQERIKRVSEQAEALYGAPVRPADVKPLTQAELDEVAAAVDPDTEVLDRDRVAAADDEGGLEAADAAMDKVIAKNGAEPTEGEQEKAPTEGEQEKAPWAP